MRLTETRTGWRVRSSLDCVSSLMRLTPTLETSSMRRVRSGDSTCECVCTDVRVCVCVHVGVCVWTRGGVGGCYSLEI